MSLLDPLMPVLAACDVEPAPSWRTRFSRESSKLLEAACGSLRLWWRTTTDPEYLASRISRRPSWRHLLPAVVIAGTCVDWAVALSGVAYRHGLSTAAPLMDLPVAAAVFAYARSSMKSSSLMVDTVIGFLIAISSVMYMQDLDAQTTACNPYGAVEWVNVIVLLSILGVHGLVIVTCWLLCAAQCALVPRGETYGILGNATMVAAGALGLEFLLASLHGELRSELRCKQLLLDSATDGSGVVDVTSGIVLEASNKMLLTIDRSDFVGQTLQSLVSQGDEAALAKFFGDVQKQAVPAPVLVTCTSNSRHFDLRMVPFAMKASQIGFCVQLVGEVRNSLFHSSGHPLPAGPGASSTSGAPAENDIEEGVGQELAESSGDGDEEAAQGNALPPGAQRSVGTRRSHFNKSRATLSLSSWSIFSAQDGAAAKAVNPPVKKVETRTIGTQASRRGRPPRPATMSTFPSAAQAKAAKRARLARRSAAVVHEGQPQLRGFEATPPATRLHALQSVARCCNVTGSGCCGKHVAWMGLQGLITDVMLGPCEDFRHFSAWQCPDCSSVHDFEAGEGFEADQICPICIDVVTPVPPNEVTEERTDATEQTAATAAAATASEPEDSSGDVSDDSEAFDDDLDLHEGQWHG